MAKPEIELRNVKHTAYMSEETHCYQASLFVDGEKWGTVSNSGHGGADDFHGCDGRTWDDIKALNGRIAKTFPPCMDYGEPLTINLEIVCGDKVNEWLRDRDFKRAMSKRPLFLKPGQPGVFEFKMRNGMTVAAALPKLRAQYPAYRFLQDMPESAARDAYFA